MVEAYGKYANCKIFTDNIEKSTFSHIMAFLNNENMAGSKIRIMPDCHDGKGCVIGTTMAITDKIIPSVVGCDIGCGMLVYKLAEKRIDLPKLDSVIKKFIDIDRDVEHSKLELVDLNKLNCSGANKKAVSLGFGTLGGGNHFIEVDKDSDGNLYLVIHSGSRNLGIQVEKYHQDIAYLREKERVAGGTYYELSKALADKLKSEGREKEINGALAKLRVQFNQMPPTPYELCGLSGVDMKAYLNDMKIAQEYATYSRMAMAETILKHMKLHAVDIFETIHNYIDIGAGIIRKGAVRALSGEKLIIPINMKDGSLICIGKGNEDWNCSAPHGAGRLMSRAEAKSNISLSAFKKEMKEAGVFTSTVGSGTLSEAPGAYKPMTEILKNIKDTVEVVEHIKPIYNYKSGCKDEE